MCIVIANIYYIGIKQTLKIDSTKFTYANKLPSIKEGSKYLCMGEWGSKGAK